MTAKEIDGIVVDLRDPKVMMLTNRAGSTVSMSAKTMLKILIYILEESWTRI